jgi:5-(carboxyamino)imidazole ribonucleotide mutase
MRDTLECFCPDHEGRSLAHAQYGTDENALLETAVDERREGGIAPDVGIIMGSDSDWKTMHAAAEALDELEVSYETRVVSAHRSPDLLFEYAAGAEGRGLSLIIAGAGGAAHLPGMTASKTILPVIGVPVMATPLNGFDALLSIMQMPAEVGVATVGVGSKGADRAARFAAAILSQRNVGARGSVLKSPRKIVILANDDADFQVLQYAEKYLLDLGVPYEKEVIGPNIELEQKAHRVADLEATGTAVFIAGSGTGIGFACEVARRTKLPVLGVPIVTRPVTCVDEVLRQFTDMPPGVATFAIGKPGAINAALFAATVISEPGSKVWDGLRAMRIEQIKRVKNMKVPPIPQERQ